MASKKIEGAISPEQIAAWKKEHRDVWQLEVEDELKGVELKTGYFRKPTRQEMSAAMKVGKKDDVRMAEVLLKNIYLGGDIDLSNDDYFFAALNEIEPLLEAPRASLKKL